MADFQDKNHLFDYLSLLEVENKKHNRESTFT